MNIKFMTELWKFF